MKITIEIDATPQEVREFFGLPDIRQLQSGLIEEIQKKSADGTPGFDAMALMRPLFPGQMQSLDTLQKAFWESFNSAPAEPEKKPK